MIFKVFFCRNHQAIKLDFRLFEMIQWPLIYSILILTMMKINPDLLAKAIEMRKLGALTSEISKEINMTPSTVNRWLKSVDFTEDENALHKENLRSKMSQIQKYRPTVDKKTEGLAPSSKNYPLYLKAIEMRKQGCSLDDIKLKLDQPKTTVYSWIKHIELTEYQKQCLIGCTHNKKKSLAREKATEANRKKYSTLREVARQQGYDEATGDPVHVAGCMLYWAEGSKGFNAVEFSNTDVLMQIKFKEFLEYLKVPHKRVTFSTRVHNTEGNATHTECKIFWSEKLGIPKDQIKVYDANDSRGDSKTKSRYPFGVGRLCVYDYTVIQRIYGAIERYIGEELPYGRK